MSGFLCTMVGASFATVTVAAQVLRSKKSLVAIGNAQVDTAQSKFGGASLLLDGTGDYLSSTTPLSIGTGDWTVETWIRTGTANRVFFDNRIPTASAGVFFLSASGYASYYDNTTGTISGTTNCADSTWRHLAFSKSGTTLRIFVNGALEYTATGYTQDMGTDRSCTIGAQFDGAIAINGHMDEFRISNVARYTAAFVAPTLPFSNDDNTLLLIHADGTDGSTFFEDDNGATTIRTAKTIVVNGNAQLSTAQEKFGQSSVLLDGTGDYLFVASNSDFGFGTGDFTLEGWFRFTNFTNGPALFDMRAAGGTEVKPVVYCGSDGRLYYYVNGSNRITGNILSANTWYHISVSRSGTSTKMFQDGTQVGSTYTDSNNYPATVLSIGIASWNTSFSALNGYVDEVRVSKVARYTANFTAPTATFANDANTVLLIHAEGADASVTVTDDNSGRTPKGIQAFGNAQVSTTQSKFGGASAYFDGTGDYLTVSPTTDLANLMNGDFTIEFWMYSPETGIDGTYGDSIIGVDNGGGGTGWIVRTYGSKLQWVYDGQGAYDIATFNPSANTWHHIAFVRSGTTLKCYTDGTERTVTSYADRRLSTTYSIKIGKVYPSQNDDYNGYLDEIRISNSARYTANFTAPIAPFVNDSNTLLLIHADGTNGSTVFRDDNGITGAAAKTLTASGNAQLSTAQYKFGTSSLLLDGNGDYLTVTNAHDLNFQKNDFTIEAWVYFDALSTSNRHTLISNGVSSFTTGWIKFAAADLGAAYYPQVTAYDYSSGGSPMMTSSTAVSNNTWYHIAWVRNGTNHYLYLDGTQVASNTDSTARGINVNMNLSGTQIGRYGFDNGTPPSATYMDGYIDEMRISNVARYTAAFTPSTTAFTPDGNTLFLSHFEGANASTTILDSGGRSQKGITAVNNAQISTAQSKFGGASALFDGTNDYLTLGANSITDDLALTSNYWTVEYWARITSHIGAFQNTVAIWNDQTGVGNVYYFSTNMYNGTNKMGFQYIYGTNSDSGSLTFGSTLATGVWQHHAFVRNGNTLTAYLDGVSQGTHDMTGRTIDITGYNNSGANSVPVNIGAASTGAGSFNGYLDEIRISKVARYTAAFTPSTTPFQNDDNTVLLLHMDGTNGSTVFFDDNGAKPYTP